jgi:hypothetical protein
MMRDYLIADIEAHLAAFDGSFAWGSRDCVHFCAAWVLKRTGRDLIAALPAWNSETDAGAVMNALGHRCVGDGVTGLLEPRAVPFARPADIVQRGAGMKAAIGICLGHRSAFLTPSGLWRPKTSGCNMAWSVD